MTSSSNDPFPRDRVAATLRRLPAYLRLAWRLARDPVLGRARRVAVMAAAGYLASPVDLVPGVIPVAGQLDDIAVAIGALKFALAGLDVERRREHLLAVGLEDHHLADDLRTAVAASAWLIRAGARTTGRMVRRSGSAAKSAANAVAPATREAAARAGPAARSAVSRGASAAEWVAGRRRSVSIKVTRPRIARFGSGRLSASDEMLVVEPDLGDDDSAG